MPADRLNAVVLHVALDPITGAWSVMRDLALAQAASRRYTAVGIGVITSAAWPDWYAKELAGIRLPSYRCKTLKTFGTAQFLWQRLQRPPVDEWVVDLMKMSGVSQAIVHFHNAWMSGVFLPLGRVAHGSVRVVATMHGMFANFDRKPFRHWLHRWMASRLVRYHARLTSVDRPGTIQAERVLGIRRELFTVIPNGVAEDQTLCANKWTFAPRENWGGVEIHRVYSTGYCKKTKWRRAVDFASFSMSCCVRVATMPRHDVVVALTTPPLISFIGAWRARLWRSRFCYWVMDLNPDEAIAAGWLRTDSAPARILERMSRFGLRQADAVVVLDRFMKDRIAAKGIAPEKIAVIPPWSHDDEVRFDASGRKQFRKAHGLGEKFVVMYSGNHSPVHPLDTLMQAAERLRGHPDIVFCFVGGGGEFERVKQWARDGKGNALCLPYQPLNQLAASLSAADLHTVVMGNPFVGLVHPCKIYNVLTVGAPVLYIGPQPSHVTEILNHLDQGHPWDSCPHGDVIMASAKIQRIMDRARNGPRQVPVEAAAAFSKSTLLPHIIAKLERLEERTRSTGRL